MLRVFIFKNSFLAALLSMFAYVALATGIIIAYKGEIARALTRKWIRKLKKDGIIEQAKGDTNLVVQIYQTRPNRQTLQYIRKINPSAADYIDWQKEEKKKAHRTAYAVRCAFMPMWRP